MVPTAAWSLIAKQNLWWNCLGTKFDEWNQAKAAVEKAADKKEEDPDAKGKGEEYVKNVKDVAAALEKQQSHERIKKVLEGAPKSKHNPKKQKVPGSASLT